MERIYFRKDGHLGIVAFNRPDKYNSFTRELALETQAALDRCRDDAEIRAVLLTGVGKAFSAGQDLQEVIAAGGPSFEQVLLEHLNPIVEKIMHMEKPVLAAVNGVAAGAGANIALACDIVIAAESARFIQAFSKIGLIPDSGGSFLLPRLIGWQRASALMMLGEPVPAREAEAMGMIYKALPEEGFLEAATEMGRKLAAMPTLGLALTKKALQASAHNDLAAQLALEEQLQTRAGQTHDYKEGVQAFLEKRQPEFKGH